MTHLDLTAYRQSENERQRLADLLRLLPDSGGSILEIGSRDGYHSAILASKFDPVVGVDLETPKLPIPGVRLAKATVTDLPFHDRSFGSVLCAEVLEHVPDPQKAAAEITRVSRAIVLIGVPYRQDIRVGKLTCARCGKVNPPYGHVNTFDEQRLQSLFHELELIEFSYVAAVTNRTNALSSWLMTRAGNPWASYNQDEPCIFCGSRFEIPAAQTMASKVCTAVAHRLDLLQRSFMRPSPAWIHALFRRRP